MKGLAAALAIVVATGVLAPGAASAQYRPALPVARFTDADDGQLFRLPVGAELTVRLPEQAGTAYEWQWRDDQRVQEIGEPRVEDVAPRGVVGGTQLRTFRFQVVASGRIPLTFLLKSSFAARDRPTEGKVVITIDGTARGSMPLSAPDKDAQVIGEREADWIVSTKVGKPIEIHLSADDKPGYVWQVLSSRNIAFDGPIGVEHKPGIFGLGAGAQTTIRLRTTVQRSDGWLELVYIPRGQQPDRFSRAKTLSYHFTNQR